MILGVLGVKIRETSRMEVLFLFRDMGKRREGKGERMRRGLLSCILCSLIAGLWIEDLGIADGRIL